ncbi:hypothetical protein tloyanaT_07450 [Thalassotalea loyana]|uniref:Uncharacterized protein n=1 Tax=Thalassotalea loyana TaxID=280483 RepID=A0ABQ6H8P4_9GAMM|nr:hypothetical protein [Thalassotalea loyana]GLX84493.1 hypothetical protein tloyanaT_07450 [Thalassotalea loyana]
MSPELTSSLLINGVLMIIAVGMMIKGKQLRDNKSSSGNSASSNPTSAGTGLLICGAIIFVAHAIGIIESFI